MNARLRTCLMAAIAVVCLAAVSPASVQAQGVTVFSPGVTTYVPGSYGGYTYQPYYGGYSYATPYYSNYRGGWSGYSYPAYGAYSYPSYSYPSYSSPAYAYPSYSYPSFGYRTAYRGGFFRY